MLRLDPPTLLLSPQEGARLICLSLLQDAEEALAGLESGKDPEALHSFRVALRRLRSTCRAYRPYLKDAMTRKLRSRLKEAAGATSGGRDSDVQLEWLGRLKVRFTPSQRPGVDWLRKRLEGRRAEAYRQVIDEVAAAYNRLGSSLRRKFSFFTIAVGREPAARSETLARAAGRLLRELAEDLAGKLAVLKSLDQVEAQHTARISSKRLRYHLEPLLDVLPEGEELLLLLKELQELLGDLNDAHTFAAELAAAREGLAPEDARLRPGLTRLGRLVRERQRDLFAHLEHEWLNGPAGELLQRVSDIAGRLAAPAKEGVEVERKFLLSALPESLRGRACATIEQGWLPGEKIEERVRRLAEGDGARHFRTVKVGAALERIELEDEISRRLFESLWRLTRGRRVRKRRYRVPAGDLVWEIDEFLDRELILAEVEIDSPGTPVQLPDWLAPVVLREVTGEAEFYNVNLAR